MSFRISKSGRRKIDLYILWHEIRQRTGRQWLFRKKGTRRRSE